jgi:hypothetical protein
MAYVRLREGESPEAAGGPKAPSPEPPLTQTQAYYEAAPGSGKTHSVWTGMGLAL